MLTFSTQSDPETSRPATTTLDRFFVRLLNDPRDLPFIYLGLLVTFTLIPLAVLLYMPFVPAWLWWTIAVVYLFINNITFKGPFGLMLHCTTHRRFFKKKYDLLNHYLPWVLAPFFGQSPETYRAHHIGMHHVENNLEPDESSTMPYQRDSGRDFLRYYFTFLFTGIYTLVRYLFGRNRDKLAWQAARGEVLFILFCAALCFVNWQATVVAFILPFIAFRLVAMAGNWVQHTFICPEEPENPYRNSITCINVKFNRKCWNDGYHISHHVDPTLHWTEHPRFFREHREEFARNRSVVFDNLNYTDVFILLLRDRYDLLAQRFVDMGGHFKDDAEVIAFLRSRVVPIPFPAVQHQLRTDLSIP
ncbi:MAG: fatty acid desaturase [Flavobacteriales bacterium]|nr:fatty acid desaturase [Flavobacteriales bacterium]